ncbi:MAG: putative manganese-dependent inorganic diphosphatase [Lawsonibacter sp.]|jgi:manganese-dependent inorganic pyrophosphatase|uniref:putative manganese-dependent inorganic diphosphatase n=1 Tax=Lawsonibacter sp. JLR.KK007 TaxID=3114293 RepID=UPI00216EB006|nr:putative manganese-dependent inorganic diphosphatase [Lawsonibacter sp.]MCI8989340.1 putative manganese-dependent inorganic diphosphatase [Lawsonibacter sp.]MCI9267381.1 putative manganese-dependent inorganic diphosphatase [Lawsonibacter sp.]
MEKKIKVIGHRNPDTDSICAAITYSNLKNLIDPEHPCKPCRAGLLNRETEFVLNYFKVPVPQLYTDVSPHIRDVDIRPAAGVDGETSLRRAWMTMRDQELDTLCIVDENQVLQGVITVKDVATANMNGVDPHTLEQAGTSYQNLLDILDGTVLVGDITGKRVEGRVVIGAGSAELIERSISPGDIVIVSNRAESQLAALEMDAACMIVGSSSKLSRTMQMLAEEKGCIVISTPNNTYITGQILSQAAPIRHYMTSGKLLTFGLHTPVEEATRVMASVRFRYFPVLDDDGRYIGVVSRRNLLNLHKKQLILVDHNEKSQAAEGIDEAEVLEIIDHHRIGAMETDGPVYFRNVPVGCTCTIVYQMYLEYDVEINPTMAGLMLSAILSDTLMFRSPTCTPADERAARKLAELAGVDLETYADDMFTHGGDVTGKTAAEVFSGDYKIFTSGDVRFGVGQGSYMMEKNRKAAQGLVGPYLPQALEKQGLDYIFYMFTDVRNSSTELLMAGAGAEELITKTFDVEIVDGVATLPGVVSRKKQMIPALIKTIKLDQE